MKTYIRKSVKGYYIEFPEEIDAQYWAGKIGSTYEDFLNNKWILLSDELLAFKEEHPEYSIKNIIEMQEIAPVERTIELAKWEKILKIENYDNSEAVNSFTIGNATMWLTVNERQQIATQISANEAIGRTDMTKWFNGISYTFPLTSWKQMLIALEIYAGDALNVTESHKHNVENLTSIEEVDNYDYTTGYPEKLNF